jgi:hypothetical protein
MKSSGKNRTIKMLLLPILTLPGLVLSANAFDIDTSLSNSVNFIGRSVITNDGTQNGNKVMDINT